MSLRHIVLFYLLEGIDPESEEVEAANAAEQKLADAIPGNHGWVFGTDVSRREISADFAGVGDFDSTSALADFLAHPAHKEAARLWTGLARWTVADIKVDS